MSVILQDTGYVLVKPFFPGWLYYRFSVFYSKNAVYVQLSVGIWHRDKVIYAQN